MKITIPRIDRRLQKRLSNPGVLTVLIAGQAIGTVAVAERLPLKVFGKFSPGVGFEKYRSTFENAEMLARTYDECDNQHWDRLMQAYDQINRLEPVFAELPVAIEEFAVQYEWEVEITFASPCWE
jgi:hypothetical protein